jgi:hypothetical protein
MNDWQHRVMVVPAAFAPLARALAVAAAPGESGAGMWVTELSPDSGRPPTHYISAGSIWGAFADLLPLHDAEIWDATPEEDRSGPRPTDSTGHPEQVVALASEAGQPVPLATVQALFAACRVYTCCWQRATEHLGLRIVKGGAL